MSTQYRLVQSGNTASGGCSAGQGSSEPVAPRIYLFIINVTSLDTLHKLTFYCLEDFIAILSIFYGLKEL
jgi:carbohydrate-binding DOMON domain-containing protein